MILSSFWAVHSVFGIDGTEWAELFRGGTLLEKTKCVPEHESSHQWIIMRTMVRTRSSMRFATLNADGAGRACLSFVPLRIFRLLLESSLFTNIEICLHDGGAVYALTT